MDHLLETILDYWQPESVILVQIQPADYRYNLFVANFPSPGPSQEHPTDRQSELIQPGLHLFQDETRFLNWFQQQWTLLDDDYYFRQENETTRTNQLDIENQVCQLFTSVTSNSDNSCRWGIYWQTLISGERYLGTLEIRKQKIL